MTPEERGVEAHKAVCRRADQGGSEAELLNDLKALEIAPALTEQALQDFRKKIKTQPAHRGGFCI
jgi:hypothetical protein